MADVVLIIVKSKDGEKRDSLTIQIDDKAVFIPTSIVTDFINNDSSRGIRVIVPGSEE